MTTPSTRVLRSVGRWVLELLIVFVGVLAAFQLSQYQADREADRRRHQIVDVLSREIEDAVYRADRIAEYLPRQLDTLQAAIDNGERPVLPPLMEAVSVRANMWEIAKSGDALDLLDVETVFQISQFYNGLDYGLAQLHQLTRLTETYLLPNLGSPADEFYTRDGSLRPRYQWYMNSAQRLVQASETIRDQGRAVLQNLGRANHVPPDSTR